MANVVAWISVAVAVVAAGVTVFFAISTHRLRRDTERKLAEIERLRSSIGR
jgi:hypothetical protein